MLLGLNRTEILAFTMLLGLSGVMYFIANSMLFSIFCAILPITLYLLGSRTRILPHSFGAIELLYYTAAIVGVMVVFLKTQNIQEIYEIENRINRYWHFMFVFAISLKLFNVGRTASRLSSDRGTERGER